MWEPPFSRWTVPRCSQGQRHHHNYAILVSIELVAGHVGKKRHVARHELPGLGTSVAAAELHLAFALQLPKKNLPAALGGFRQGRSCAHHYIHLILSVRREAEHACALACLLLLDPRLECLGGAHSRCRINSKRVGVLLDGLACLTLLRALEALNHRNQLRAKVGAVEMLLVKNVCGATNVPSQNIEFRALPVPLENESCSVFKPLWRVGDFSGENEHFPFLDDNVLVLTTLDNFQTHITLDLVEKLLSFFHVVVAPCVRSTDHHHLLLPVPPDELVADWWLKELFVLFDPLREVDALHWCVPGQKFAM
mmetsp:Transcript_27884/g.69923  ORF Transcript_27884/g.69923 Transcript_27884/m.69923 type:complete len:309 (+) Transcript_27884:140-1066(+)